MPWELGRAAAFLNCTAQIVLWLRVPPEGLEAQLHQAALTAASLLLLAASLQGQAYHRHRLLLAPLLRLLLQLQPSGVSQRPAVALFP